MSLKHLHDYATETELRYIKAVEEHGSQPKAAKALGVNTRTVERTLARVRKRASLKQVEIGDGEFFKLSEAEILKGVSTYITLPNGVRKWIKTNVELQHVVEMMREACEALKEDLPKYKPIKPPKFCNSDLINIIPITDYHIGMAATVEETGTDWTPEIAERLLVDFFAMAIEDSPNAETAVFAQLGDFMHWDSILPVTPAHRHILRAACTPEVMVRVAYRVMRRVVDMLLAKHRHVHVIVCPGNHDEYGTLGMREFLFHMYEDEPRLTVDMSHSVYYAYEFGLNSFFFHHGHKRKPKSISDTFAAKFREIFGRTKYSWGFMGHMHHLNVIENAMMVIEQLRTLSAKDRHTSEGGYDAGRDAMVATFHRFYGHRRRSIIPAQMLLDMWKDAA